jgi:SAM-dependent methyltransferase
MNDIQQAISELRWYHEIWVAPGIKTVPETRFTEAWDLIDWGMAKMDLKDKLVLDIGTRDGKYAFAAEKMGAYVDAIDSDQSKGALLLKEYFQSKVSFRQQSVYDVNGGSLFYSPTAYELTYRLYDVIFFFGVLYHLRYPMWGLKKVCDVLAKGGKLYIEGGMFEAHNEWPLMFCPVRESPYEITSCTFFNLKGLTETLWSFGLTVTDYQTHPSEEGKLVRRGWIEAEKTHETPADLNQYWNGLHTSHSTS